jgi:hypothetical protein
MRKNTVKRVFALVLTLVTGALGVAASMGPVQPAEALQCCSKCDPILASCEANCGSNQACLNQCNTNFFNCITHCSDSC